MVIELRGVEFKNKGAELMLIAILTKLRNDIPYVKFVMEVSGRVPITKLYQNNIYVKPVWIKRGYNLLYFFSLLPKTLLKPFKMIKDNDIQVVLDASGFAFGDQWGAEKAGLRMANHIVKWKLQNKKTILLPQAFGPFSNSELSEKIKLIIQNADLIFARDKVSYNFLKNLVDSPVIRLSPDFTNLLVSKVNTKSNDLVWIIPNSKMLTMTTANEGSNYMNLIVRISNYFTNNNITFKFLIHEIGGDDRKLAEDINRLTIKPTEIVVEPDPLIVKSLIGSSLAIVSSRFHGIVSALSQGIPCLATGWSHKYEMLLEDYNYKENLVSLDIQDVDLNEKLKEMLDSKPNKIAREKLKCKSLEQKILVEGMWQEVIKLINS